MMQTELAFNARKNTPNPVQSRTVLHAYAIIGCDNLAWDVNVYEVLPKGSFQSSHGDRGAIVNVVWEMRKSKIGTFGGYGYVIDLNERTVVVPRSWELDEHEEVDGYDVRLANKLTISAATPAHSPITSRIIQTALKSHFKKSAATQLGMLWQDYNSFCEMPRDPDEEADCYFCRRYNFDTKRLRNGIWVIRFSIGTATLDSRTFADYFTTGSGRDLATMIEAKLRARQTRRNTPSAVRVWHSKEVGKGGSVLELQDPNEIMNRCLALPYDQARFGREVISCQSWSDTQDLSPATLRLVLESFITEEAHRATIIGPQERFAAVKRLRDFSESFDAFGRTIKLESHPIDATRFPAQTVRLPEVYVRAADGGITTVDGCDSPIADQIKRRVTRRADHIRRFGFVASRPIQPLLAVPQACFNHGRAQQLLDLLNCIWEDDGIEFRFEGFFIYRRVDEIARHMDDHGYDAVLVALPESWRHMRNKHDTHEQIKKQVAFPSQCIFHDNTIPNRFSTWTLQRLDSQERRLLARVRQRLDLCLQNLLVKHHWMPFVPAEPFFYNTHVGLDVGGIHNGRVVACLGHGFQRPADGLIFRPHEIPMDLQKAEPIEPTRLYAGLLELFETMYGELNDLSEPADFERALFFRDGQFMGAGDEWNEREALMRLYDTLRSRDWITSNAVWTGVEVMKRAEGWRLSRCENGFHSNPLVGYSLFPFEDQKEGIVCTTGLPYTNQGTASPLKIRIVDIGGKAEYNEVVQDLVWEADMCLTKPDMGRSLPWVLHVADTGALQASRSYRLTGITV